MSTTAVKPDPPASGRKALLGMKVDCKVNRGHRQYMEDAVRIHFEENENHVGEVVFGFFAVFDGHGGPHAARFAKQALLEELAKDKNFWDTKPAAVKQALKDAFLTTHTRIQSEYMKWPKCPNGFPSTSGTTGSCCVVRGKDMFVANVGDSSVVLCKKIGDTITGEQLTKDHKPSSSPELERIESMGGKVVNKLGVHRVCWMRPKQPTTTHDALVHQEDRDVVPFLAIARSLGDLWSYNPHNQKYAVSPHPDVNHFTIDPKAHFSLVVASDGLWNVISPNEAATIVYEHTRGQISSNSDPSDILLNLALARCKRAHLRADNISVISVMIANSAEVDWYGFKSNQMVVHTIDYSESMAKALMAQTKNRKSREVKEYRIQLGGKETDKPQQVPVVNPTTVSEKAPLLNPTEGRNHSPRLSGNLASLNLVPSGSGTIRPDPLTVPGRRRADQTQSNANSNNNNSSSLVSNPVFGGSGDSAAPTPLKRFRSFDGTSHDAPLTSNVPTLPQVATDGSGNSASYFPSTNTHQRSHSQHKSSSATSNGKGSSIRLFHQSGPFSLKASTVDDSSKHGCACYLQGGTASD